MTGMPAAVSKVMSSGILAAISRGVRVWVWKVPCSAESTSMRSPGLTPVTPAPTLVTIPAPSCPNVAAATSPMATMTSRKLRPVALISTSIWSSGSGAACSGQSTKCSLSRRPGDEVLSMSARDDFASPYSCGCGTGVEHLDPMKPLTDGASTSLLMQSWPERTRYSEWRSRWAAKWCLYTAVMCRARAGAGLFSTFSSPSVVRSEPSRSLFVLVSLAIFTGSGSCSTYRSHLNVLISPVISAISGFS